ARASNGATMAYARRRDGCEPNRGLPSRHCGARRQYCVFSMSATVEATMKAVQSQYDRSAVRWVTGRSKSCFWLCASSKVMWMVLGAAETGLHATNASRARKPYRIGYSV